MGALEKDEGIQSLPEGGGSGERLGEGRGSWEVSDRSDIILLSDNFLVLCVSRPQGQQGPSVGAGSSSPS